MYLWLICIGLIHYYVELVENFIYLELLCSFLYGHIDEKQELSFCS